MSKPTVVEYAVDRLSKLGITDCFGIPGDFALPFNDAIASNESIQWLGCSNELNASYAADGYARIRRASMLCTTYAVGELNALCGVMGAKAERSAIFYLVDMSSMRHQHLRKAVHHTLPAALGCKDWFTAKVKTNGELEAAMQKAEAADTASYIEIVDGNTTIRRASNSCTRGRRRCMAYNEGFRCQCTGFSNVK